MMKVPMKYWTDFGGGDGGEGCVFLFELTDAEAAAYTDAVQSGMDLNRAEALQSAVDRAIERVEAREMAMYIELEDDDALQCAGLVEMDPDELNALVADRDPHALAYFKLTRCSEEKLEAWDANDLESLPLVRDFDEDFEPTTIFDEIPLWVEFCEPGTEAEELEGL